MTLGSCLAKMTCSGIYALRLTRVVGPWDTISVAPDDRTLLDDELDRPAVFNRLEGTLCKQHEVGAHPRGDRTELLLPSESPRSVDRYIRLPSKFAEIVFGSGSVVSGVTLVDFDPGGGGDCADAAAGASAATSVSSPAAIVRTLLRIRPGKLSRDRRCRASRSSSTTWDRRTPG